MGERTPYNMFASILAKNSPEAIAWISGNEGYEGLTGIIKFFETPFGGAIVSAEIYGLPASLTGFYGMHIHEFGDCTLPFDKTGMHYNPDEATHPTHVGDMPPLPGNDGYGWTSFFDGRFEIKDIVGRSVVIHSKRDDFTSQPAGDSGDKIGCGVIQWVEE